MGKAPLHEPASDSSACYCPSSSVVPTWWDPAPTADGRPSLNMHIFSQVLSGLDSPVPHCVRESSCLPFQHPQDNEFRGLVCPSPHPFWSGWFGIFTLSRSPFLLPGACLGPGPWRMLCSTCLPLYLIGCTT